MNNLIDNENEEINETQEVIVKRSRGRPRTKPIDLEPKENKNQVVKVMYQNIKNIIVNTIAITIKIIMFNVLIVGNL